MKFRLLALPLLAAGVLSAQGPGHRSLTPPTTSEVLTREVDFLTKFYGLNTTQAGKVTTIVSTEQSCLPTSAKMTAARQALVAGVKTGGDALTAAISGVTELQDTQEGCRATAASAIWLLLDPATQQTKGLGPLLGGFGGRGRGPGRGPGHGPHGPPPAGTPATPPAKP